jgi:hypothetical protein
VIWVGDVTGAINEVTEFTRIHVLGLPPRGSPASIRPHESEFCNLLVPLTVQFDRTLEAFSRWKEPNLSLELTIKDGNEKARQLLMDRAQLVPSTLRDDQRKLIEHYDRWLEKYDSLRVRNRGRAMAPFVFVGPDGVPFPRDAETHFRARRDSLQRELGSVGCS